MIRERFTKLLAQTDSKGTTQSACGGAFQVEGVARLPVLRQVCLPRVGDIHPVRRRGKERLQMKLRYGEQNLKALQPTKKTLPFQLWPHGGGRWGVCLSVSQGLSVAGILR